MTHLKPGDKAPEFVSKDQNGKEVKLSDYSGKSRFVFLSERFNSGLYGRIMQLSRQLYDVKEKGFEVIGVSADDEKRHLKFIEKHELPFTLLADTEKEVINAYGVWGLKKFMGREYDGIHRESFVIDEKGNIEHVIHKVKTKLATEQIMELYS